MTEPTARFLRACSRLPVDRTPVWFMRQAGRYMAEYRELRKEHGLLDICRAPELAAEVTLQPIRAFDLDAAIVFADILLPLVPMGLELEFVKGVGPVIHNPVRSDHDIDALVEFDPAEEIAPTMRAIEILRQELPSEVPLIGFAGAPFTLASYMIEGGSSRNYKTAKSMMFGAPQSWAALMDKVASVTESYVLAQIEAGAQAVQLFDSWVGALNGDDYRSSVLPYSQRVLQAVAQTGTPSIHFGTNTATLLELMAEAGGDVISVDWRIDLDEAWRRVGHDTAVQGNLDPIALFAPVEEIERRVKRILERADGRPGHIFNLGHGILPGTPTEAVRYVTEAVHSHSAAKTPDHV